MHVIGRSTDPQSPPNADPVPPKRPEGPTGRLGPYRARDGSTGAVVNVDLDRSHAGLVVGKRGSGKSYTLGVLAEAATRARGVAPVVVDPLGVFRGLAESDCNEGSDDHDIAARVVTNPTVRASGLPPRAWPELVGLDATTPTGSLVWRAATETSTLDGMRDWVVSADVDTHVRRAASNHLELAASWHVFDPDGITIETLGGSEATVLDLAGRSDAAMNAVCAAVARGLYDARVDGRLRRLPWLFVDEAHAFFDGIAAAALQTLLTRGRAPGVSLVAATQRPSALPSVAVSQADLLFAHRLTLAADIDALATATPTFLDGSLTDRLPSETGVALVVDDATESTHLVQIRERTTPHGGESPRAHAINVDDGSVSS